FLVAKGAGDDVRQRVEKEGAQEGEEEQLDGQRAPAHEGQPRTGAETPAARTGPAPGGVALPLSYGRAGEGRGLLGQGEAGPRGPGICSTRLPPRQHRASYPR